MVTSLFSLDCYYAAFYATPREFKLVELELDNPLSDDAYAAMSTAECEKIIRRNKTPTLPCLNVLLYTFLCGDWTPQTRKNIGTLTPLVLQEIILCKLLPSLYVN
jgi:predicted acyltransferase